MKKLFTLLMCLMLSFTMFSISACKMDGHKNTGDQSGATSTQSADGGQSAEGGDSAGDSVTGSCYDSASGSAYDSGAGSQSAYDSGAGSQSAYDSGAGSQSAYDSGSASQSAYDSFSASQSAYESASQSAEDSASSSQGGGEGGDPQPTEAEIKLYDYFTTTTLPVININTENGIAIDDRSLVDPTQKKGFGNIDVYNYVNAEISVSDAGDGFTLNNVAAQVKVRGNYTSTYPKRPIRIKFNKKQKMAGLNGGKALKSWVLLAEYKDSSMLRNSVAFYLGNSLLESNGYYCADFRYVEVYINGQYNGLYLLTEQQQVNSLRVDIPEAEDPDDYDLENITPEDYAKLHDVHFGYLVEYDGYYNNEPDLQKFTINYNNIKHADGSDCRPQPSADSQSGGGGWGGGWGGWGGGSNARTIGFTISNDMYFAEQRDFIKKCMQTIWQVVYDANYRTHTNLATNPYHTMDADGNYVTDTTITSAYEAVSKVVDVKSLVDMYLIQEICEDMDISWSSFYMSLDMSPTGNHLLTYCAPWDFDSSLGSASGATAANNALYAMNTDNPWLVVFANQQWFWDMVAARFDKAEKAGVFTGVIQMIDVMATTYVDAYARNFSKWTQCMGRKIEGQQVNELTTFRTQADAAAYLKTWLSARITNLKGLINAKASS